MEAVANVDVKYAVATGDLEYTSTGTVSKDKTVNGAGLSVRIDQGGKPTEYAAGLSMLGGSEAVYNVEGKGYEAFRAYVSLSFDNRDRWQKELFLSKFMSMMKRHQDTVPVS